MLDQSFIARVLRVCRINPAPGQWVVQKKHGTPFQNPDRPFRLSDLGAALMQRHWLATRAFVGPCGQPRAERLAFDIDCKSPEFRADRDRRYWSLRTLMGDDRVPLVYQTPGGGLRVVYPIPEVTLTQLVTGYSTGLVADVLRGADMRFGPGRIEIFPQAKQADRVMFGRRMPILDPATLALLGPCPIRDGYDPAALSWALRYVEERFESPDAGLLDHLRALPRVSVERVTSREGAVARGVAVLTSGVASEDLIVTTSGKDAALAPSLQKSVERGLEAPSTRTSTEFLVAVALIVAPHHFPAYGLTHASDDAAVAHAVALWLSRRHNGFSKEWRKSQRWGRAQGPVAWWAQRYLRRSAATGLSMIARARGLAYALVPGLRLVVQNTARERAIAHRIATRSGLTAAEAYRFEVWLNCLVRAVKRIELYHERRGHPLQARCFGGQREVLVEIAAEWMEEWPYGKGAHGAQYTVYRDLLTRAGVFGLALDYVSPTLVAPKYAEAFKGTASRYWVHTHDPRPMAGDLPFAPWDLQEAAKGLGTRYGRSWTTDELYHALWVRETGVSAKDRWGRRTNDLLQKLQRALLPLAEEAAQFGYPRDEAA